MSPLSQRANRKVERSYPISRIIAAYPNCTLLKVENLVKNDLESRCLKKPIEVQAEIISGLKFAEGGLYHKDRQVDAVTIHQALAEFLEFLGDEPVTLFGHNCKRFACLVLFNAAKSCDRMEDLEKKVTGYVDTLPLFRDVFPGLPPYRQITLYQHLFRESYAAHVGMSDVTSLKRILVLPSVTPEVVYRHSFDLDYIREGVKDSLIKQKRSAS
ncbi:uncharacterized protein LOC112575790 [Pomacea canaliculata]|uniref:uncharacterized protein LOC112575790 n=1 Tax=Pomacea canaliculata TaxID=400727 RepID=UPI000D734AE6|nr:uncharacterized protein LOC112575790 [Pomacea canaliculata]